MTEESISFRKNVLIAVLVSVGIVVLALVVAYLLSRPKDEEVEASPEVTPTVTVWQQQPDAATPASTTPVPGETPDTAGAATAVPPTQQPADVDSPSGPRTYTVQEGDVLSGIAYEFGVSIDALKRANGLEDDLIRPGQKLIIPSESGDVEPESTQDPGVTIHVVEAGDVLGTIAKQYGVSVEDIMSANDMDDADMIREGQELIIPNQ